MRLNLKKKHGCGRKSWWAMHRSFLCAVAVGCWQQTGVSGSFCPATVIVLIADDCFVYAVGWYWCFFPSLIVFLLFDTDFGCCAFAGDRCSFLDVASCSFCPIFVVILIVGGCFCSCCLCGRYWQCYFGWSYLILRLLLVVQSIVNSYNCSQ